MKMRIPGNVTGWIGQTQFEDGVTVNLVSPRVANQFRAVMAGVEILQDDGKTVDEALNSMAQILPLGVYADSGQEPPSIYLTAYDGTYLKGYGPEPSEEPKLEAPAPVAPVPVDAPVGSTWTIAELEAIADAEGINGLRAIGQPSGITGRSIRELIDAIFEAKLAK